MNLEKGEREKKRNQQQTRFYECEAPIEDYKKVSYKIQAESILCWVRQRTVSVRKPTKKTFCTCQTHSLDEVLLGDVPVGGERVGREGLLLLADVLEGVGDPLLQGDGAVAVRVDGGEHLGAGGLALGQGRVQHGGLRGVPVHAGHGHGLLDQGVERVGLHRRIGKKKQGLVCGKRMKEMVKLNTVQAILGIF